MIPEAAAEAANDAVLREFGTQINPAVVDAILEAAAPHMLAEAKAVALEDAAAEVAFWNKAGGDDDITQMETINWLCARAKSYRPTA